MASLIKLKQYWPYISSKGEGEESFLKANGFSNTRSGLQDASVFLKFKPYSKKIGNIKVDFLGTAGITTPLGDYLVIALEITEYPMLL